MVSGVNLHESVCPVRSKPPQGGCRHAVEQGGLLTGFALLAGPIACLDRVFPGQEENAIFFFHSHAGFAV